MYRGVATALSIVVAYYLAIILHEWGHGLIAWIFGYKPSPFDVDYGGWFLLNVDEAVPYREILAAGRGYQAALIGIAGLTVSLILFLLSLIGLRKLRRGLWAYSLLYWFAVRNMEPIVQYLTVETFSVQGDVGRFIHGLAISPWWVFIPGAIFVAFALYRLLGFALPKAYAIVGIESLAARRIFLFATLFIMFLQIYSHGYNPLSDEGMPSIGKWLAIFSILLVPILFFVCNPSREWVKRKIEKESC